MHLVRRAIVAALLLVLVPATVLAAPPPLTVTAQPSPVGILSTSTGTLYVFGSIRCSHHTTVEIFASVIQPDDQAPVAQGDNTINVPCSQTPSLWVVPVVASTGAFTAGPAQLSWHWSAESQIFGRDQPLVIIPF